MNLTQGELLSFVPYKNLVLCESVVSPGEVDLGGVKITIDTTFNPSMFQPIIQKVLATPKRLVYGKKQEDVNIGGNQSSQNVDGSWNNIRHEEWFKRDEPIPNSMPWKTTMQVKRDDIVWVGYFSIIKAEAEHRLIICEGKKYYLIPYQDIYLKKNGDSVTMLNGWLLLEPLKPKDEEIVQRLLDKGIVIPKFTKEGDKYAIVRYMGEPVDEYLEPTKHDTDEIALNDTVLMSWMANRRLEQSSKFFDQKEYIVSRRTNICAILKDVLYE